MRLERIDVEQFRSLENQSVPAEGLVVLFGANSAGKTSVLEAVEDVITQASRLRSDPGADEDPYVIGTLYFDLPAAGAAGSKDAQLYGALLRGEHIKPELDGELRYPWDWLDNPMRERLAGAGVEEAISILADALAGTGHAGSADDRQLLARSVFDPGAVYGAADYTSVSLNVYGPLLPAEARAAAIRIAAKDGDDPLRQLAADLKSRGSAHLGWVATGSSREFAASFPPVIGLDGDIESLSAELERAVVSVHDRLWNYPFTVPGPGLMEMLVGEPFQISQRGRGDRYAADPWLEFRSEDGRAALPGYFHPYDEGDWYRVRHSILASARMIAQEADRLAPGFVRDQGTIGVEVLPVSVWGPGRHRVRATFTPSGEDTRDLRVVGAGTARWAAAAIRLAAQRLSHGRQVVTDENGVPAEGDDGKRRIVPHAYQDPLGQAAVRLEPSTAPAVYIADEPEAHLHPSALRSVATWLSDLSQTAAMVLIATHSVALLDSPAEVIHRVSVERSPEGTQLREMTGSLAEELSRVADTLGLTQGELLLLTRLALFVEGPHDEAILGEWFGHELRTAGIRVLPVHGADHFAGLLSREIVTALGVRVATLSDDTDVARAWSDSPLTRGERAVARLAREARAAQVPVHAVGLDRYDILWYLDEAICREQAPGFPGWREAIDECPPKRQSKWKRWIEESYGLSLSRDDVSELARQCRARGRIPAGLTRTVRELIAYATAPVSSAAPRRQEGESAADETPEGPG